MCDFFLNLTDLSAESKVRNWILHERTVPNKAIVLSKNQCRSVVDHLKLDRHLQTMAAICCKQLNPFGFLTVYVCCIDVKCVCMRDCEHAACCQCCCICAAKWMFTTLRCDILPNLVFRCSLLFCLSALRCFLSGSECD